MNDFDKYGIVMSNINNNVMECYTKYNDAKNNTE